MRGPRASLGPLVALLFVGILASGCIDAYPDNDPQEPRPLTSLGVYEYRYTGDAVALPGIPYGWMARLTNYADSTVTFLVTADEGTTVGPAEESGWKRLEAPAVDTLAPGASRVYLFQATWADAVNKTSFQVDVLDETYLARDEDPQGVPILERGTFTRNITWEADVRAIDPGQHVKTATVGVWLNGTSFYTNIRDLYTDPTFPYPPAARNTSDDLPLAVYVYDQDASEQPPGSKDDCRFVTIAGYNALIKTQAEHGTNVRWLAPDEAYTREGAEDHSLYGDVLIFQNTIVMHDGDVGAEKQAPNPTGFCFDPNNTSPVPIPSDLDLPPTSRGPTGPAPAGGASPSTKT